MTIFLKTTEYFARFVSRDTAAYSEDYSAFQSTTSTASEVSRPASISRSAIESGFS